MILYLIFSLASFAADCPGGNWIDKSDISLAIAQDPSLILKDCTDKKSCVCFSDIVWEAAVWDGKTLKNDPLKMKSYRDKIKSEKDLKKQKDDSFKSLKEKLLLGTATAEEKEEILKLIISRM